LFDLQTLAKVPPVQGILRAKEGLTIIDGQEVFYDTQGASTYDEWVQRLDSIFATFAETNPDYLQIRFLDENGNEMVRVNNQDGKTIVVGVSELQNKAGQTYFIETMKLAEGELYVSPLNLNRENGVIVEPYQPVVRFATSIFNAQGVRKGILVTNVDAKPFLGLVQSKSDNVMGNQISFLADPAGTYLSHHQTEKLWGADLGHDENVSRDFPALGSQMLQEEHVLLENDVYIFDVSPVHYGFEDRYGYWVLVTAVLRDEVLAPARNQQRATIGLSLASLLVALVIGTLVANYLTRPIGSLTQAMDKLKNGDLTISIPLAGRDEIGRLRDAIVETITTWRQIILGLSTSSEQLLETSVHLSSSAEEMERTAQGQSDQIVRTSSSMEEMSRTIQEVADNAETTNQVARESSELAQGGAALVSDAITGIGSANLALEQLRNRSSEIGTIINLIQEIAAQTNILALNAAIEAAGAGQSGARFNVVADEIRKLASRTGQSTSEISALIGAVQKDVQDSLASMETGTQLVKQVGQKLAEIVEASIQASDMMQLVSSSAVQQTDTSEEIASTLERVVVGSQETVTATQDIARMGLEMSKLAERLKEIAGTFKV